MDSTDERFYTSRNSARKAGYASSEDERFATPRGNASTRSLSSDNDNDFLTPRDGTLSYSSDEHENVYSDRERREAYKRRTPMSYVDEDSRYYKDNGIVNDGSSHEYDESRYSHQYAYYQSGSYSTEDYNSQCVPSGYQYEYYVDQQLEDPTYDNFGSNEDDIPDVFSFARHNRVMQVEKLLDRGVPVNVQDRFGNTILSIACQNGLRKLAKVALRRGADINSQNYRGNTPLHFCFTYGYGDTLGAYLISKGADTTIRNADGVLCYDGIGV